MATNFLNDEGFVVAGMTPTGIIAHSISDALVATGTTQGTALALTSNTNFVATTASGTGVLLPVAVPGASIMVRNNGANTLNVFPPVSAAVDAGSVNAAVTLATATTGRYVAISATQYRAA